MTTIKSAAEKYADFDVGVDLERAFLAGAFFERERILEELRKQSFRNNLNCHQWADWIEKRLKQMDGDAG